MNAVPYDAPEQHFGDHVDVIRWLMTAALRRRQVAAAAGELARDDDHSQLITRAQAAAEACAARVAVSSPECLPLERIRRTFDLSINELRGLVLLVALELDTELREAARQLVSDPSRPHPDVGLLAELFYIGRDRSRVPEELGPDGRLVRFALIRAEKLSEVPFALRRVRAVNRIVELVHGRDALDRDVAQYVDLLPSMRPEQLVLDAAIFDEVVQLIAAAFAAGSEGWAHPVVMLAGPDGAGRTSLVTAAAAVSGLATLRVRCASLPQAEADLCNLGPSVLREAILARALVLFAAPDRFAVGGPARPLDEGLLAGYVGPIAAVVGRIDGRPPQFARGAVIRALGVPAEAHREELWRRALAGAAAADVPAWAAARYRVTPGVAIQAARAARATALARARAQGDGTVTAADVHAGLRTVLDAKLATSGTLISGRPTWDDLVLPEDSVQEIREFIARVNHRRLVYETWGFGAKLAKGLGLSALFAGPPGTGKTMVASLIAGDLGLDLYQVDLSKVVSKWVGETEKNLSDLFDAAEAGHAVLLFDEADSLFAKRTEVKSSNDRHANLEVNYLLQRMESFGGITILTTNNDSALDDAFRRRLSLKIDFPIPEIDERERLWRTLLPAQAAIDADIDFDALADRFEMTGGHIKNATLRAAFLAADEGTSITMRHLLRGARSEYQAMGKLVT